MITFTATLPDGTKWTAPAEALQCYCAASGDGFLYVGVVGITWGLDPPRIYKINPATMTVVATWVGEAEDYIPNILVYKDGYIFAGFGAGGSTTPKVKKIDVSTMTTAAVWNDEATLCACKGLVHDGTSLYASLEMEPGKIYKINPATMATVAVWAGEVGENNPHHMTHDGTYLYSSIQTQPGQVFKINPATMTKVSAWVAPDETDCMYVVFDGTYIYAAIQTDPGKIYKINPATMTTVAVWNGAVVAEEYSYNFLVLDGIYIYSAFENSESGRVYKINTDTMLTDMTFRDDLTYGATHDLAFNGKKLFIVKDISVLSYPMNNWGYSVDPGVTNVLEGVGYVIDGVAKEGTLKKYSVTTTAADTIRQQIMDVLDARLKTILTVNGYKTNLGQNVRQWDDEALPDPAEEPTKFPAIKYRDTDEKTEDIAVQLHLHTLPVELEIIAVGGTAKTEMRKMIADVIQCIGADLNFSALAEDTKPISPEMFKVQQADKFFLSARSKIEIEYTSERFNAYI